MKRGNFLTAPALLVPKQNFGMANVARVRRLPWFVLHPSMIHNDIYDTQQDENEYGIKFSDLAQIGQINNSEFWL